MLVLFIFVVGFEYGVDEEWFGVCFQFGVFEIFQVFVGDELVFVE